MPGPLNWSQAYLRTAFLDPKKRLETLISYSFHIFIPAWCMKFGAQSSPSRPMVIVVISVIIFAIVIIIVLISIILEFTSLSSWLSLSPLSWPFAFSSLSSSYHLCQFRHHDRHDNSCHLHCHHGQYRYIAVIFKFVILIVIVATIAYLVLSP